MEPVNKEEKPNPVAHANLFSKLFFCWLNPLLKIGHKRRLEEDDMYKVLPEDSSEILGEQLQWYWDKEVFKAKKDLRVPHLTKAIMNCYWKSYSLLGAFTFLEESVKIIQPILIGNLISYFESYDSNDIEARNTAYGYAAGVSLCSLSLAILHHLYFYHVQRAGMKLRVAMCHMIYKKALCLNHVALGKTTTGQIVNLLSNDVNKFDQVRCTVFNRDAATEDVRTQVQTNDYYIIHRSKTAVFTDSRIKTMNEVISGIRIIKMYAWEKPFAELVHDIRRKEISKILKSSYLRGMNLASFFFSNKVIQLVTFMTYVLLGNIVTASRVFVAVSLYNSVRLTVALFFPLAIEKASESLVSIRRIKNFLLLDEIRKISVDVHSDGETDPLIHMQDVTCYWDKTLTPTLQNISLSVTPGKLLAVIGSVGAGKSSLLSALLGELAKDSGTIDVRGRLVYAAQQPWVFSGTIKSNILFGKKYQKNKYEEVIQACALKKDLELLEDGDLTLIGDRGVTLSGGQKARVNLARAVYWDADIYLLDDPLSAVDAEVGKYLFEQCICGALRKKPRILVTHQLQYLTVADQILILKEGEMVGKGTYAELLRSGIDFASLLKNDEDDEQEVASTENSMINVARDRTLSQMSVWSHSSSIQSHKEELTEPPGEVLHTAMAEETRSEGIVGWKIYKKYLMAGANCIVLLLVFLTNISAEVAYVLQDWWLAYWADEQGKLSSNEYNQTNHTLDIDFYLGVYAGLTGATILFGLMRSLLVFKILVDASQTLHSKMFKATLRAPVLFFDINPIGKLLHLR
nr:PREDICTED: multidrug resistance-associated protein 4 [Latimeria chalumnae]|eukprot:XP_014354031.1 PREDICTED: multidrug resistance-associated protein 4 [Latimeria chalumnae]